MNIDSQIECIYEWGVRVYFASYYFPGHRYPWLLTHGVRGAVNNPSGRFGSWSSASFSPPALSWVYLPAENMHSGPLLALA